MRNLAKDAQIEQSIRIWRGFITCDMAFNRNLFVNHVKKFRHLIASDWTLFLDPTKEVNVLKMCQIFQKHPFMLTSSLPT